MDRIKKVREIVDKILLDMTDSEERRYAYLHLYGVSQACALLSVKRNENVELAIIAGMLHDIYSYTNMSSADHAHKGAELARKILEALRIFDIREIDLICSAIYNHSDKGSTHDSFDELLKDADVLQHVLYNPLYSVKQKEETRWNVIKKEFDLES